MPVFPSQDLYGKKICESYQQLLQIYDNDVVLDGSGSQKQFLNVTASYALNCNCVNGAIYNSVTGSFVSSSTWTFNHNLNTRPVSIQAYDTNYNQIIPQEVVLVNDNTAVLTFTFIESGFAIANGGSVNLSMSMLQTGSTYPITSSWSLNSLTASYALNGGSELYTGSTYPITASWALNALNGGTSLYTGSTYPITSSWAEYSTYSTYSVTASYALNAGTTLETGSYYPITSSWALTASYALNAGTPLQTGSVYPITSSWSETAGVSIQSLTSSYGIYAITASYALNCNCGNGTIYNSVTGSFVSSSTWTFNHNLNTRPVSIQAYDINYNQIVPQDVILINDNTAVLTFPVSESGFAIANGGSFNGSTLQTGSTYPITSSWALTASYALNGGGTGLYTGSTYPITASWALNALNGGTKLQTGSYYPITSSYALTASYALNCNCFSSSIYSSVTGSFVSSSTWVFTHNLQTRPVLVQAYDYFYNQIIPSNIILVSDNVSILTFPISESGFVIATRSGLRTTISGSTSNCCLQTGSTYPITASWALNALNGGTKLQTGSYYPITSSWALNSNYAVTASYIGDSVVGTFVSSSTWVFNHNLQARPVLIQAYDINYNQIVPQDIMLIDDNTALLAFPVMVSGFAIATRSGFRSVVTGTPMYTGSYYPITSSWAVNTQTSSYIQVTGVSYPVKRIYNNYTVVRTTDYTVLCDATNGEFNVKLPNPVGNTNIYNIKKIDTSGHRINVTVTNASLIDYELTQSIAHRGTNMMVQSDGTNQYWIL